MKLVRLRVTNFQGLSFDEQLCPINVFVGANGIGKTARANAARLVLIGYLPELGKTNAATFALASGREMTVEGTFDNGDVITRSWKAYGNSVKKTETIPDSFKKHEGPLTILLNPQEYFGKTDRERVDYVFANVKLGDEFTEDGIYNRVCDNAGEVNCGLFEKGGTIQQYVEKAIEAVTKWSKGAKDTADRMTKTIQGLAHLQSLDDAQLTGNRATSEKQAAKLTAKIAELNQTKGGLVAAFTAGQNAKKRRHELAGKLAEECAVHTRLDSLMTSKAANEQTAIETVTREQIAEALQSRNEAEMKTFEYFTAKANAETRIAQLKKELETMEGLQSCPCCGVAGEGWKDKRVSELTNESVTQAAIRDSNAAAADEFRAKYTEAKNRHSYLVAKQAQFEEHANKLRTLNTQIVATQNELVRIEDYAKELASLPEADEAILKQMEEVRTALDAANEDLRLVQHAIKTATAAQSERKRLAEAEAEREKATADQAIAKAAIAELRAIQGEMVKAAFEPLLKQANTMFAHILGFELEYSDGEIGRRAKGTWVTHKTFGGAQKVMTYVAICAALAKDAPVKCIITDELKAVDDDSLIRFMDALGKAIQAGHIDNVIGTEPGRCEQYETIEARLGPEIFRVKQITA